MSVVERMKYSLCLDDGSAPNLCWDYNNSFISRNRARIEHGSVFHVITNIQVVFIYKIPSLSSF